MNRVSSIFSQMLKLVPPAMFQNAVDAYRGERHSRGFRSWNQFVAMLFCQLGQAESLENSVSGRCEEFPTMALDRWISLFSSTEILLRLIFSHLPGYPFS